MQHETAQRLLLGVVILALAASFVFVAGPGITANVVQDACVCAPDAPVCAVIDETVYEFASACEAECSGARIIFEGRCGDIGN